MPNSMAQAEHDGAFCFGFEIGFRFGFCFGLDIGRPASAFT